MLNVYDASVQRIRFIFREFEKIVVSVSGGKDSTCLFHLVADEAKRTSRTFDLFFLDQEAEYESTIDMIRSMMSHPLVVPRWYQVPILMTNATSHDDYFLHAWEPGAAWIRDKDALSIKSINGEYPNRFYKFFPWLEKQDTRPTAHIVGLRIFESMNRQRTMLKANGYKHYKWSTASERDGSYRFYPLFDWQCRDVWKFIADRGVQYNKAYDRMVARSGVNLRTMRVSNLIHEQAFRSLAQLQEFEPNTYDKMVARLGGVHCAATYSDEAFVYKADKLPKAFGSWKAWRDYLLATTPTGVVERFRKRFAKQGDEERTCQHQVKQMLLNDWEGKLPKTCDSEAKLRAKWWHRL